jgi:stress response protein YsnF
MDNPLSTAMSAGMLWWDLLTTFQREMQRASLESFSVYSPASDTRIAASRVQQPAGFAVVALGEERLNVATRTLPGETTRVRRRVIAQPVEQQVTLRDEKVILERRPPTGSSADGGVLTETVIEMSDSRQVPAVWKSLHVAEEVVLRKQVTERTHKVREIVRRDVIDVEHAKQPAFAAPPAPTAEEIEARLESLSPVPPAPPLAEKHAPAEAVETKLVHPASPGGPPAPAGRKS